jgi:hypothetical protein
MRACPFFEPFGRPFRIAGTAFPELRVLPSVDQSHVDPDAFSKSLH